MKRRIRVGLNLLWLRPGIVGGTEEAATATVAALAGHESDALDVHAYAQPSFRAAHRDVADLVATRTFPVAGGSPGPRILVESSWLPLAVRRDRIDVVHCYGGVIPPGLRAPSVLTVHDIQPLEPGSVFSAVKKRWLTTMLPRSVDAAGLVAVPSQFVRGRLVDLLGADPDRIVVVPHGTDRARVPTTDPDGVAEIRRRFRLDGPFVLYAAITYPHKNHRTLIEAFAGLPATGAGPYLVLAGGRGEAEDDVDRAIERLGIGDRVRRVGRVGGAEIRALTAGATAAAFPSRYEGFGLPVLEALEADTPVVVSGAGSLPEIVGDAGVVLDPDDVAGWTVALSDALEGAGTGPAWTARRRARVARFSWADTAALLTDAYRRVVTEHGIRR